WPSCSAPCWATARPSRGRNGDRGRTGDGRRCFVSLFPSPVSPPDTIGLSAQFPPSRMSSAFGTETVLDVRHWTDDYFSFTTTRDPGLRFTSGQFVMLGLEIPQPDGSTKPLLRAYSIASASWEEQLEFFSIKVPDGALTSRLQHVR